MPRSRLPVLAAATTAAAVALPLSIAAPAAAAPGWQTVADWRMNEARGATVMADSSSNELHGRIGTEDGSAVSTGVKLDNGNVGYQWFGPITKDTKDPRRIISVPDDDRLEPGADDFAVEVRFYTGATWQNVVQKGQSGFKTVNGQRIRRSMWKFDISNGRAICTFHGPGGTRAVSAAIPRSTWHVVRCERTQYITPKGVQQEDITVVVNGAWSRSRGKPTGFLDTEKWPVSIGGKSACASSSVSCDYFIGRMDYVKIESAPTP